MNLDEYTEKLRDEYAKKTDFLPLKISLEKIREEDYQRIYFTDTYYWETEADVMNFTPSEVKETINRSFHVLEMYQDGSINAQMLNYQRFTLTMPVLARNVWGQFLSPYQQIITNAKNEYEAKLIFARQIYTEANNNLTTIKRQYEDKLVEIQNQKLRDLVAIAQRQGDVQRQAKEERSKWQIATQNLQVQRMLLKQ